MADPQASDKTSDYRLTATFGKNLFRPDEPVRVTVVFQNVSNRELPYGAQAKEFDYLLDCRDGRGEPVPLTRYGSRVAANRGEGRYLSSTLAAGENLTAEILVNRHLDLTIGGRYTLRVTREVFPHRANNQPAVASNTSEFQVVDG